MLNPNVNALPTEITGGTTNNVPAHLEEVKDAINGGSLLRRLSQAQIDALSGATRPIGLSVENLTTGRTQKWDGARWVDLVDSSGATFSGDLTVSKATPRIGLADPTAGGAAGFDFSLGGVRRWVAEAAGAIGWRVNRYGAGGAYADTPLLVREATGQVVSSSHIGGVWSGSTNGIGVATFSIPASPTGNWAVALTIGGDLTVSLSGVTSSSVSIRVWLLPAMTLYAGPVVVHWHAIAY